MSGNGYLYKQELTMEDQRLWSILIHLGGIFFGFIPSLIGYLLLRDRGANIRGNAAQALNFQITLAIAWFIAALLANFIIGFLLLPIVGILALIFPIFAAVAASRDEVYVYPLAFRFLR